MSFTFDDLERLAEEEFELSPGMALTAQQQQFQSAPLAEILVLLDSDSSSL